MEPIVILIYQKLVVDSEKIKYRDNSGNQIEVDEDFVNLIPKCFELVTISDAGIASILLPANADLSENVISEENI